MFFSFDDISTLQSSLLLKINQTFIYLLFKFIAYQYSGTSI